MLLLVGLGNPGPEHRRQRHNVGFMAVDAIAEKHSFQPFRKRFHGRSEEHTSELQSLMRISYAVFCLKKKNYKTSQIRKENGKTATCLRYRVLQMRRTIQTQVHNK